VAKQQRMASAAVVAVRERQRLIPPPGCRTFFVCPLSLPR
jgi:hypothetical protein